MCYWKNPLSDMLNQKNQDIFLSTPKRFCIAAIIVERIRLPPQQLMHLLQGQFL